MENLTRLKKSELQRLFRSEFGEKCLNWAIYVDFKKQDYIDKIREKEQYENCEDEILRNRIEKTWRKQFEPLMECIKRFI